MRKSRRGKAPIQVLTMTFKSDQQIPRTTSRRGVLYVFESAQFDPIDKESMKVIYRRKR